MPRRELMSWDGEPNFRWVKMYRGVRYRVTCEELGTPHRTKEATIHLANEWWEKKLAELNPYASTQETDDFVDTILDEPAADNRGEAVRLVEEARKTLVPVSTYKKVVEAVEEQLGKPAAATERTVRANGEAFLRVVRTHMKPRSYEELAAYINSLNRTGNILAGEWDVRVIDEDLVERMYLHLRDGKLSDGRKKKHWSFFQRFVRYLWERRLIEMPRNLASHKFEVRAKKIKTYTPEEVRRVLKDLKPRLKLYALLALNAGMTQVDISELRKDMVDLKAGALTRKRVKTGDNENVPVVCYKLWPETLKLLKKYRSEHPELFLTNMRGNPLVETRYEGEKVRRKDMVVQQWRRAKVPMPLKAFRSIAATWIEGHPIYGRCTSLFLGHSPKSVKDRHYAAPPQELLDQALTWLHGHLFGKLAGRGV